MWVVCNSIDYEKYTKYSLKKKIIPKIKLDPTLWFCFNKLYILRYIWCKKVNQNHFEKKNSKYFFVFGNISEHTFPFYITLKKNITI